MSLIDPLSCGFIKVGAYDILTKKYNIKKQENETAKDHKARLLQKQHESFNEIFNVDENENLQVTHKQFVTNFPRIIKYMRDLNKRQGKLKNVMFEIFSKSVWEKLSEKRKATHSINNCKGCLQDPNLKQVLAKLPIKSVRMKSNAKKAGLHKEKILRDITNNCVNELNEKFQNEFRSTFVKQAKKYVPEFQEKKTSDIAVSVAKAVSKDCSKQYAETSVIRYH